MPSITVQIPRQQQQRQQQELVLKKRDSNGNQNQKKQLSASRSCGTSWLCSSSTTAIVLGSGGSGFPGKQSQGSVVLSKPGQRCSVRVDCSSIAANLAAARSSAGRLSRKMVKTSTSSNDLEPCEPPGACSSSDLSLGYGSCSAGYSAPRPQRKVCINSVPKVIAYQSECVRMPDRKLSGGSGTRATLKRSKSAPRRCVGMGFHAVGLKLLLCYLFFKKCILPAFRILKEPR